MTAKDAAEVVRFMARFARLKAFVDDDPTDLVNDAIRDESVRDLCADLSWDAFALAMVERDRPELFVGPVDPAFIAAWRDYQNRYEDAVDWISGCVLVAGLAGENNNLEGLLAKDRPPTVTAGDRWSYADEEAAEAIRKIDGAVDFAKDQIDQADRWSEDQEGWIGEVSDGVIAWTNLLHKAGIDLRGMLRRRALVPFVLVPRKVANQQGSSDRTALLRNLKEAQDAFVRGTLVASAVLLRATVEVALKEHYRSIGKDLNERINSVRGKLPFGVTVRELHELRELANFLLHEPKLASQTAIGSGDAATEIKIASLLVTVRALIEGVK